MRVLFLTREYPPHSIGGISKHIFWLVKSLKKIGVKCKVISFGEPSSSTNDVLFIKPESSVSINKTNLKHNFKVLFDIKKIDDIANDMFNTGYFDILHVEDPYLGPFLKSWNIVTTVHDTSVGEINSMIHNIQTGLDIKYLIFFSSIGPILEHLTLRKTKMLITINDNIKNELIKYYKIPNKKINIIPNGVFVPDSISKDIAKKKLGLETDSILIFTAARLIPRKRLDIIIKATKILINNIKCNFSIVICGDGPQKPFLLDLIKKYDLHEKIKLKGWVDEKQLLTYYEAADIFIMPSEYEGMPISLLEAFSYGVVPICSNIPELKKFIIDGYNGLFFESGNIKQLAKQIQKLTINHKLRNYLLNAGRKSVKYYDWDKIASKTKLVYDKVLEINKIKYENSRTLKN